jgi:phosphomannomutase
MSSATDRQRPFVHRRLAALGRQVLARHAHFGLWIDGCGQILRLVDERGKTVDPESLCRRLAAYVCKEKPGAAIVLEPGASALLENALVTMGAHVIRGPITHEATCATIETSRAEFACGPSGTFWFAGTPAVADALLATSLLLVIFSQSDRPVSDVLDAG